jgi:hypothetical protein
VEGFLAVAYQDLKSTIHIQVESLIILTLAEFQALVYQDLRFIIHMPQVNRTIHTVEGSLAVAYQDLKSIILIQVDILVELGHIIHIMHQAVGYPDPK